MEAATAMGPRASAAHGPSVRSKPRYAGVDADLSGRVHLAVCDASGRARLAGFVAGAQRAGLDVRAFDEGADASALPRALAGADMGWRLYLFGAERWVWLRAREAQDWGLHPASIRVWSEGAARRAVYCVHCRTVTEDCRHTLAACSGCGRRLAVRDHFSREVGAYMGVQADAEVPGELPPALELTP